MVYKFACEYIKCFEAMWTYNHDIFSIFSSKTQQKPDTFYVGHNCNVAVDKDGI